MNDTNIVCFLSAARTKNISLTARHLSMTQQAVSRNIQKLELELGYPLLNRNTNKIVLTYAGEEYYKLLSKFDKNLRDASIMTPWLEDGLNVGWCDFSDNSKVLRCAFQMIKQQYPDLKIHYVYGCASEIVGMYNSQLIDLAILPEEITHFIKIPSLQRHLEDIPCYIISSADHPLAGNDFSIKNLENYPILIVCPDEKDMENMELHIKLIFSSLGITAKQILAVKNVASLYSEILNGNGYAIYPSSLMCLNNPQFHLRDLNGFSLSFATLRPVGSNNQWAEKLEQILIKSKPTEK